MSMTPEQARWFAETFDKLVQSVGQAVLGKNEVVRLVLTAMMAPGHVLLEDAPGTGKTSLARSIAATVQGTSTRIQFTPDLLPSDVTGVTIYDQNTKSFEFHKGPVFANVVLADEINRASPKTQSAMLEVMEEGRVTVDGVTHEVGNPFMVIATQNPVGAAGTALLPDSQLDRFLLRLTIGYPTPAHELELLRRRQYSGGMAGVEQVLEPEQLLELVRTVERVHISDEVLRYIVRLTDATRSAPQIAQGASPRATFAVASAGRAAAFLRGRDYVLPEDVQCMWVDVVAHRLILAPAAEGSVTAAAIAERLLRAVEAPKIR